MMNEECQHEKILEHTYWNKADNREVVVSRCCEKCLTPFEIQIEDEYHAAKIEFFRASNP